jgi:hypothetical protein
MLFKVVPILQPLSRSLLLGETDNIWAWEQHYRSGWRGRGPAWPLTPGTVSAGHFRDGLCFCRCRRRRLSAKKSLRKRISLIIEHIQNIQSVDILFPFVGIIYLHLTSNATQEISSSPNTNYDKIIGFLKPSRLIADVKPTLVCQTMVHGR